MGSGFFDFTAGQVLTDSQVDGYLMRQTVMTFADASARNTALSGVLDEGMYAYLEDVDALSYYNGSAWRIVYQKETTWSPTWVNLTVGNGSVAATYTRSGDLVYLSTQLTFGSTTSISGTVSISNVPVTGSLSGQTIASRYVDASATDSLGQVIVGTTSITLRTSTGGNVTSTSPFTWTTSDIIIFNGCYIAA